VNIYLGDKVPLPFKLKKTKYVLKARKYGSWEDIEEYDKKVSLGEIGDLIEDLRNEGYDYVRLEELDDQGRRVKLHWSKPLKPKGKKLKETLDEISETVQALKAIKDAFKDENQDPYVILASTVSMLESFRKICDSYPALCGKESSTSDPIFQIILSLIQQRLTEQQSFQPAYYQPATQNIAQSVPSNGERPNQIVLPKPTPEAIDKINKIATEALEKAMKTVVSECQALGTCIEPGHEKTGGEEENE
jgi:hypothetical protein